MSLACDFFRILRFPHNRLTVGEAPRAYDMQQHRAFLLRREIGA
ncbi:hypothetical protein [Aeromonas veronii]